ncbi:MAG: sigma-70 family RNA polymerase sigma factor [Pyrinomonadaceae bacterium]|nr:sigma-70 family RNA polymerase sigma factor [Pyrinomonadaceae bacterium]
MAIDFEQTIRENAGILHKLCRIYSNNESEYEEIFQEMMIQIWRSLPNFRGDSQLSTWLYRICINTALNFRTRTNKFKRYVPLEEKISVHFEFENEKDVQLKRLYQAIRELKPIDRAIVSLYLDEKSYEETAQILGISKTNVATRLMRLKQKLIERLS